MNIPAPVRPAAAKAATGPGAVAATYEMPLDLFSKSAQKACSAAQRLYRDNPWVRRAEITVSGRASNLPWHLEDDNEVELDSGPAMVAKELLDDPQGKLDLNQKLTGREMWRLTYRHMGLCGYTFWYADQRDASMGIPLGYLYINPARMWQVVNKAGNLIGWSLDGPPGEGLPLETEEILPFYLDPPDGGYYGIGLVEAVWAKARLSTLADNHAQGVLQTGGRIAGIMSVKNAQDGLSDDEWSALIRDFRNINEDPNATKRMQIVKKPVDFIRTAGTMQELAVLDVSRMARDDIFAVWGVPLSQAGITVHTGLNSGETKGYDEAVLWQGAIHDRVTPFKETIEARLLDLFPTPINLVIDEPSFDDEAPQYALADVAKSQPLTRNERRTLIGLDPLPDWDEETGEPLGIAIDLPATFVTVGKGESTEKRPNVTPPEPQQPIDPLTGQPVPLPPPNPFGAPPAATPPAKASRQFLNLRKSVDTRYIPNAQRSILRALAAQQREIAAAVRAKGDHLAKRPSDTKAWWNVGKEEKRLLEALRPHAAAVSETVTNRMSELLPDKAPAAKADAWEMRVEQSILNKLASRVKDIAETTRQSIASIIEKGLAAGQTPNEVADTIEQAAAFNEARAEMIARTEMGTALNDAALGSYAEFGVTSVEVIDGDGDEVCADADGQTWSLEEADGNELGHPNCVRDFIPVFAEAKAVIEEPLTVTVQMPKGPDVPALIAASETRTVRSLSDRLAETMTEVTDRILERPVIVNIPEPKKTVKTILRDEQGHIIGVAEE